MSKDESLTGPISIDETHRFVRQEWIGTFTDGPLPTCASRCRRLNARARRQVNEPISETIERLDRVIANVRRYQ